MKHPAFNGNLDVLLKPISTPSGNYEAVVAWVDESGEFNPVDAKVDAAIRRAFDTKIVSGKQGEVVLLPVEDDLHKYARVVVAGVGQGKLANPNAYRIAAAAVAKCVNKSKLKRIIVQQPATKVVQGEMQFIDEAIANGLVLGGFEFLLMRGTMSGKSEQELPTYELMTTSKESTDVGEKLGRGQNFARAIASLPGNVVNPPRLAEIARQLCVRYPNLKCTVLDEKQMKKLGMGGLLAVGGGSQSPPRLIVMEYEPKKRSSGRPLMVVGKGITFDAGGISIKPAEGMGDMIYDKCGAMAVLGLMHAIANAGSSRRVIGIIASAENVLSSTSYRPGDVIKHYNGITSEITNTDAEGRLVLADALSWGIEQYQPEAVIDLATLTGGCVVALGHGMAGAFANDDSLFTQLHAASVKSGEKIWRLPLDESFVEKMKGSHSDIVNSAGRWGSPCTAAAYLQFFVDQPGKKKPVPGTQPTPWVHLDIAGVSDSEKDLPLTGKGATGFGVRMLFEWVRAVG
jgi:leucyl aminopeptidase